MEFPYRNLHREICQKQLRIIDHGLNLGDERADGIEGNFSVSFNFHFASIFFTIDIFAEFCGSVVLSKSMSSIAFTVWEAETWSYQSGDLKLLRCSYFPEYSQILDGAGDFLCPKVT